MNLESRLILVSNRLPVILSKEEGNVHIKPGEGGLVAALGPILRNQKGLWVGWPGSSALSEEEIVTHMPQVVEQIGFSVVPVMLKEDEIELYYHGFSNEIIWPLFHDFHSECNYVPKYWEGYQKVNEKFSEKILEHVREGDFLWIHDYHLLLVAQELRKRNYQASISFFLHIPFPPPDLFLRLPWRVQILKALLEYNLIGFQTHRDKRNFIHCVRKLLPNLLMENEHGVHRFQMENHEARIATFPISIDFKEISRNASTKAIAKKAWEFHEKMPDEKIVFSLDRLDFTKGIPYRLRAIDILLEKHPELHEKVSFLQVVIPSRINIRKYIHLKDEIDRLVGKINSKYTKEAWVPIKYMYRSLSMEELLSCYRTSEIALITPLKDGMNLVSKEYIASNIDTKGVLILSEFAGAASELYKQALLVNPYDIEGIAEAIYRAFNLPEEERKKRMQKMRRIVRRRDIYWWIRSFLNAAISKIPKEPLAEENIHSPKNPSNL